MTITKYLIWIGFEYNGASFLAILPLVKGNVAKTLFKNDNFLLLYREASVVVSTDAGDKVSVKGAREYVF